jgi:hypothetical protein
VVEVEGQRECVLQCLQRVVRAGIDVLGRCR